MSKMIVIKKGVDKIILLLGNKHIADITIAHSSRTSSVNLSIQADMDIKIDKVHIHSVRMKKLSPTGRTIDERLNMQNLPIRTKEGTKIRKAFIRNRHRV